MIKVRKHTHYTAELPDVGELDTGPYDLNESCYTPEFHVNPANPNEAVLLFSQWDQYCENPLNFGDYEGVIFHTNRNYLGYNVEEVESAFGLDDDSPNLQWVFENIAADELAERLAPHYRAALSEEELVELCEDYLEREKSDPPFSELLADGMYSTTFAVYWRQKQAMHFGDVVAHALFEAIRIESYWNNLPAWSRVAESVLALLWRELREQGKLGNPLAVPLDVGGRDCERYSPIRDRFPEERPDGVWYPNAGVLSNLVWGMPGIHYVGSVCEWQPCGPEGIGDSKAQQFGDDLANGTYRAYVKVKEQELTYNGRPMRDYEHLFRTVWPELSRDEQQALWEQAFHYAQGVCKEYSAWAEGDCHYQVCIHYARCKEGNTDAWEMVDYDTCGGFIGREYAEEARYDYAPSWLRVSQSNEEQQR